MDQLKEIALIFSTFLFTGSVFSITNEVENQNLVPMSFQKSVESINENKEFLPDTRIDVNIQYAEVEQFDAYKKACFEMDLKCVYS